MDAKWLIAVWLIVGGIWIMWWVRDSPPSCACGWPGLPGTHSTERCRFDREDSDA